MEQRLFQILQPICNGIAKLMGNDTEVVLHDLQKQELVYIVNGSITGRSAGYRTSSTVYTALLNLADDDGNVIGYGSRSQNGKELRSSHLFIRDEQNNPTALICINQDIAKLKELRDTVDSMIKLRTLDESRNSSEKSEENIQKVMQQIILDSIEKIKPVNLDTKEKKLEILKTLEAKGVFAVKDAVPYVCNVLSISQATLYNYLRDIRSQEAMTRGPLQL